MERKIGEIFEYNGEWYQCVKSPDGSCKPCDMNFGGKCPIPPKECIAILRSDLSYVIFKKLEKVGEPYVAYGKVRQKYKLDIPLTITKGVIERDISCDDVHGIVDIGNKQKKETMEDMEEKKLNLKPFDLQKAKQGKPICTRDGRKARIICFDAKGEKPIIALIANGNSEDVNYYYITGKVRFLDKEDENDLMMLPEKKEGWINIYNADTTFYYVDGRVFETKDEAVKEAKEEVEKEQREKNEYIDTIRVEWEE